MKLTRKIQIKNRLGLHTRPATMIVKLLQSCKSHVHFTYRRETVNAKSILSILMLAANKNSKITITCDGLDATDTMDKLVEVFDNEFCEEQVR